jgi:hypothetical protein
MLNTPATKSLDIKSIVSETNCFQLIENIKQLDEKCTILIHIMIGFQSQP